MATTDSPQNERSDLQSKNFGAAGLFASLHILEEYGCEIGFNMPAEQELTVRREGITYKVIEMRGIGSHYRYGIGVDVDGEFLETTRYRHAFESYNEAVNAVIKMIRADPRQSPTPCI